MFSLRHFAVLLSWPLLYFPPRLLIAVSFPSFVLARLLCTPFFALMLIFWSYFFCVFPAFILFFPPLSPYPFSGAPSSLLSSASFPPLALTRGYSFLGWAETASLYNTDRLLCNQIPSVATSEDSLSRFLHHTHTHTHTYTCKRVGTHMHAHTHTTSVPPTPEQCACAVFMYNDPCTYNRST